MIVKEWVHTVDVLTEKLRQSTGIDYRPRKVLVKGPDGYGMIKEMPSEATMEMWQREDLEQVDQGYRDCPYRIDITDVGGFY